MLTTRMRCGTAMLLVVVSCIVWSSNNRNRVLPNLLNFVSDGILHAHGTQHTIGLWENKRTSRSACGLSTVFPVPYFPTSWLFVAGALCSTYRVRATLKAAAAAVQRRWRLQHIKRERFWETPREQWVRERRNIWHCYRVYAQHTHTHSPTHSLCLSLTHTHTHLRNNTTRVLYARIVQYYNGIRACIW